MTTEPFQTPLRDVHVHRRAVLVERLISVGGGSSSLDAGLFLFLFSLLVLPSLQILWARDRRLTRLTRGRHQGRSVRKEAYASRGCQYLEGWRTRFLWRRWNSKWARSVIVNRICWFSFQGWIGYQT